MAGLADGREQQRQSDFAATLLANEAQDTQIKRTGACDLAIALSKSPLCKLGAK